MTHELLVKFVGIANALSPENLHCDGEISMAQTRRKAPGLKAQWKALEAQMPVPIGIPTDYWRNGRHPDRLCRTCRKKLKDCDCIRDEAGRAVAPVQVTFAARPAGPWDTNHDTRTS
jgi:hypothetical protein